MSDMTQDPPERPEPERDDTERDDTAVEPDQRDEPVTGDDDRQDDRQDDAADKEAER